MFILNLQKPDNLTTFRRIKLTTPELVPCKQISMLSTLLVDGCKKCLVVVNESKLKILGRQGVSDVWMYSYVLNRLANCAPCHCPSEGPILFT